MPKKMRVTVTADHDEKSDKFVRSDLDVFVRKLPGKGFSNIGSKIEFDVAEPEAPTEAPAE